jgi:hypothetical protein
LSDLTRYLAVSTRSATKILPGKKEKDEKQTENYLITAFDVNMKEKRNTALIIPTREQTSPELSLE